MDQSPSQTLSNFGLNVHVVLPFARETLTLAPSAATIFAESANHVALYETVGTARCGQRGRDRMGTKSRVAIAHSDAALGKPGQLREVRQLHSHLGKPPG